MYTGSGKNKTTSAFGLTFRALGRGWNVLIAQFLKGDDSTNSNYGEIESCRLFSNQISILQSGRKKIVMEHNKDDEDKRLAHITWNSMLAELYKGKLKEDETFEPYSMLVLDEILPTLNLGLITQKQFFDFVELLKKEFPEIELVLTGRMWSDPLFDKIKDIADLMTDGRCIKHYFNKHCKVCKRSFEYRSNYCPNCGRELETINAREGIEF